MAWIFLENQENRVIQTKLLIRCQFYFNEAEKNYELDAAEKITVTLEKH